MKSSHLTRFRASGLFRSLGRYIHLTALSIAAAALALVASATTVAAQVTPPSVSGTYDAVFTKSSFENSLVSGTVPYTIGYASLTLSELKPSLFGQYTVDFRNLVLHIGSDTYRLSNGRLDDWGNSIGFYGLLNPVRKNGPVASVVMTLNLSSEGGLVSFFVRVGSDSVEFTATKGLPIPALTGTAPIYRDTVEIGVSGTTANGNFNFGYGSIERKFNRATSTIQQSISLPDGSVGTSTTLYKGQSESDSYPLFALLPNGGRLVFDTSRGEMTWFRPAQRTGYKAGFRASAGSYTAPYTTSTSATYGLPIGSGTGNLVFYAADNTTGTDLVKKRVTFNTTTGKVVPAALDANKVTVNVDKATGRVTGSFITTTAGVVSTYTLKGHVDSELGTASGYYINTRIGKKAGTGLGDLFAFGPFPPK